MKRRKNNNNTLIKNHQPKNDKVNNRNLIIIFSFSGKTYLMSHILHQKQDPFLIITNSENQYPTIKAQTSSEIKTQKNFENSTVVFDEMLLSKQESNIDLFFTRRRHINSDIYYLSQKYFHLPK